MAQHYWLSQRAIALQGTCFSPEIEPGVAQGAAEKQLALYLRYQTTHDRAFHRSVNQFLKLRAEKRKAEIGFESQQRKRNEETRRRNRQELERTKEARRQNDEIRKVADQTRREAAESRKQELHQYNLLLGQAKVDHQWVLTANQRLPQLVAAAVEEERLEGQKAA